MPLPRTHTGSSVVLLAVLLAFGVSLAGGLTKAQCVARDWSTIKESVADFCYADSPYLYLNRGLTRTATPYDTHDGTYPAMEYPVALVGIASAEAALTHALEGSDLDARVGLTRAQIERMPEVRSEMTTFFVVNLLLMALCAGALVAVVATTWGMRPAWLVAASEPLLLTSGMNWDLAAVLLLVAGLAAWERRKATPTGVFLALGTVTKLFPALLAPVVLLDCLRARDWRRLLGVAGVSVLMVVAANVPAWRAHPLEWGYFLRVNDHRPADVGSLWLVPQLLGHPLSTPSVQTGSLVVLVLGVLAAMAFAYARRLGSAATLTLLVTVFVLTAKVYSPQYCLWLLPLFAITVPRWRPLVLWQAVELVFFFSTFAWIARSADMTSGLYAAVIVLRAGVQVWLTWLAVSGDRLVPARRRGDGSVGRPAERSGAAAAAG